MAVPQEIDGRRCYVEVFSLALEVLELLKKLDNLENYAIFIKSFGNHDGSSVPSLEEKRVINRTGI